MSKAVLQRVRHLLPPSLSAMKCLNRCARCLSSACVSLFVLVTCYTVVAVLVHCWLCLWLGCRQPCLSSCLLRSCKTNSFCIRLPAGACDSRNCLHTFTPKLDHPGFDNLLYAVTDFVMTPNSSVVLCFWLFCLLSGHKQLVHKQLDYTRLLTVMLTHVLTTCRALMYRN